MERASRISLSRTRALNPIALPALFRRDQTLALNPGIAIRLGMLPFWAIAGMIILASIGVCSTIILRTRNELRASSSQFSNMTSEIELLRRNNASLQAEISELNTDARLIESEARSRLGMVRPNEIVVIDERTRVDSIPRVTSFVH